MTTGPASWAVAPQLFLPRLALASLIGHAFDGLPNEACGLLVGPRSGGPGVTRFEPCGNAAASSRVYTIEPRDQLRIDRQADDEGLEVVGVVHSHTHTEPYPSETDVRQAEHLDPNWHFVIVSLAQEQTRTRSFRIVEGTITEERISLIG